MNTAMQNLVVICTLAAISLICVTPASAERRCSIATHRVTGKNKLFSLICRCGRRREMLGRSIRFLDPDTPDTNAQERLTVNCIEKKKPAMERACQINGTAFERRAARVLRRCMNKRPKNPTENGLKPFDYRKDMCFTEFRELDVSRTEALLVCACTQRRGYLVHPGVIQFVTVGSPNGATEEQKVLEECTKDAFIHLNDACRNMPERFDLRSAQTFNVCCKRARVKFDLSKLRCQATVPDDISGLDLTFRDSEV